MNVAVNFELFRQLNPHGIDHRLVAGFVKKPMRFKHLRYLRDWSYFIINSAWPNCLLPHRLN